VNPNRHLPDTTTLQYGVFFVDGGRRRGGVAPGDHILDLTVALGDEVFERRKAGSPGSSRRARPFTAATSAAVTAERIAFAARDAIRRDAVSSPRDRAMRRGSVDRRVDNRCHPELRARHPR
jgi:hypothetical protein